MGHVYRAVNVEIERAVAIKVLRSEHATNAELVERFLREARAANLVRHPNVVDVVDIGRDGDGAPFIVQELLVGEDLARYVERRGGRLTLAEIEELVLPVVDAVAEAHARGVVHRDIKPENVFLAEQGKRLVPKLLDFGISKVRLPDIKVTDVGVMMGTPAYMAPEQIRGARDADPRSDVWALGIMLFELLAGRLPFESEDAPALFVEIATKDVPNLAELFPEVEANVAVITERCLRRNPGDRYPSALELARDLRHVFDGADVERTMARKLPGPSFAGAAPSGVAPSPRSTQGAQGGGAFEIPDLVVPARRRTNADVPELAAARPVRSSPPASPPPIDLGESLPERRSPLEVPSLEVARAQRAPATPLHGLPEPASAVERGSRSSPPRASLLHREPAPPRSSPPVEGRARGVIELDGGMHAPTSASVPRRSAAAYLPSPQRAHDPKAPDTTLLVGLGVVGLTAVGVTAILVSVANRPEGWPLVEMVTKPTPTTSLLVQGGLAALALVFGARFAKSGLGSWRGAGGKGSAILHAIIAGGLLFAALQLVRSAW